MLNVLAMRNAPTNRAMPANTKRNVLKMLMNPLTADAICAAAVAPVTATAFLGRTAPMAASTVSWLVPGLSWTLIWYSWPGVPNCCSAALSVNDTSEAPRSVFCDPNLLMPTTVKGCGPLLVMIETFWPTDQCWPSIVDRSITTWSSAWGSCPATSLSDESWGFGFQLNASVGAPWWLMALPLAPISVTMPCTSGSASATPGTPLTVATNEAGMGTREPPKARRPPVP